MDKELMVKLVTEAQAGDEKAAEELFSYCYNDVYYFALKCVKDADVALDITQEAFIAAFSSIDSLRDPATFCTWLKKIAYRQATKYFKSQGREILLENDEDEAEVFESQREENSSYIPDEATDAKELKKEVLNAINSLDENQRTAVTLYYFEEKKISEISKVLNISEQEVKELLAAARGEIKKIFKNFKNIF